MLFGFRMTLVCMPIGAPAGITAVTLGRLEASRRAPDRRS